MVEWQNHVAWTYNDIKELESSWHKPHLASTRITSPEVFGRLDIPTKMEK